MDGFKIRLPHTKHANISQQDIPVLNLMLRAIRCYIHAVDLLDKIAFPKECANYCQTTC